jgi:putative sugar O-methyltransferase
MRNLAKKVINGFGWEINYTFGVWLQSRKFRGDKNYDLDLVDKGFADRREEMQDDSEILNRICAAYNKAKDVQRHVSPVYRPSNEWLPIYKRPLREVIEALTNRDINRLGRIYGNFWRDPCSTGLVGLPLDMKKHFFGQRISRRDKMLFLNDTLYRYSLWHSLLGNTHRVEDLDSPCVGNPYGYFIDGTFIKGGSDYQHYYATAIGGLIKAETSKCVVELGGGFGGMAYYLLRDNKDLTYIDLDLPENMALTAYYLLKAFSEKKILLFGEADLTQEAIQSNDILIMPSFEVNNLPDHCAGLVFNSYSLAEMSRETISTYISEFTRIIKGGGYFLHVNHSKNSVVISDDFGVNPEQFDLLYKIPALWNMGRNSQMDECEYLYRRVSNK